MGIVIVGDKEMEERYGGHTWMWRNCCLDKLAEAFQMKECEGSKVGVTKYPWCMTRDTGNITITGKQNSMIRKGGLMYSQLYGMNKLQFDAMKHFPWEDGDDTMAMMALDQGYRDALRATVGVKAIDMKACRQSYNHCGRRYLMGARMNDDRSWGVREEHRMSLTLVQAINSELRCRGDPELRRPESRFQFYVHSTKLVNCFSEVVTLPIASWYQVTLGMAPEGMLGTDHQKLAILQSYLLKNSYGCSLVRRLPLLWEKRIQRKGEEEGEEEEEEEEEEEREKKVLKKGEKKGEKIGLGLKGTTQKYGFGWLPNNMFNWEANSFANGIAEHFPFPIRVLERRYNGRRKERATMMGILQEMDQMIGRIKILGDKEEDEEKRLFLLRWLATRIMRQYHEDVWEGLYKSPFEFKGKESELERQRQVDNDDESEDEEPRPRKRARITKKNAKVVKKIWEEPPPLTYAGVKGELEEEPLPVGIGKLYFNRKDFFQLIFQTDQEEARGQGWQNKPYLHALRMVEVHLNAEDFQLVLRRLRYLFNHTCHCVPNISRDRWLVNHGQFKFKPGWIAFDENGERIDCSSFKGFRAKEKGSSWLEERSIHSDKYWGMTADEATGEGLG